ncbi:tyrosine-protein kinase STYK1-like [Sinocyclocheilus anshuiensis]|nr:PREDICTED: tyrosine-protein kinase STYK1-like [Sinocyclocheilus anshuiensis]XP_016351385.1 PREDICTED: tyrosine-protein kinase STYK1-like [Sinocyclocheilus anshuiensis]XP_016351386.1 PREDICTED: tyrosine-protein kinase STYK1-like [Sinocyclocheilus anshuiensis]
MAVQAQCNSSSGSDPVCYEEGSGPLAVIIIPSLLVLSTLIVVSQIIWSFITKRSSAQIITGSSLNVNEGDPVPLDTGFGTLRPAQDALGLWEIPAQCSLEGVELLQMGRYGPIFMGQLKQDNTSTAVVIKTLKDRSNQLEATEFVDFIHFHVAVSKHKNIVEMLYCQTRRTPMYLVLEASIPGNLLHFLWSLREDRCGASDNFQTFSERSVYLVAKQVAAGLDYLYSYHRIIHGDVAARNVLIGSGLSVKVSGLDLAFKSRQSKTVDNEQEANVPVKWQAPERMMRLPLTDRSDVWSFGILLYETITLGSPPYPDLDPSEVLPNTLANYRMKRPEICGAPLYDLIKYCCMWNFKDRPVYSAIIQLLDSYNYLADTKPLHSEQQMDICEYRRKAGLPP